MPEKVLASLEKATLDRVCRALLRHRLSLYYDFVQQIPIPDRLSRLLDHFIQQPENEKEESRIE